MDATKAVSTVATVDDHLRPLQLVELHNFAREADAILTPEELEQLREEVAVLRPLGSVIRGTGGLRKLRWGAKGKGKRGEVRIIYYYGGDHMPIFLIAIYAKSEKDDLSAAEKRQATKLVDMLVKEYEPKRHPPGHRIVKRSARRK